MNRPLTGLLTALALLPAVAGAQAGPFVSRDDPRLPLFDHLVARGEVRDPLPLVRPLRQSELTSALAVATPRSPRSAALVAGLRSAWSGRATGWNAGAVAGAQGYSRSRRDLLHPAGPSGLRPYAEARGGLVAGPFTGAVRALWEPRLPDDPDWVDTTSGEPRDAEFRFPDTYLAVGGSHLGAMYGTLDREWGPVPMTGLPVGSDGYTPPLLAFDFRAGPVTGITMGGPLREVADPVTPDVVRHFTARRLDLRLGEGAYIGLWESGISSTGTSGFLATMTDPFRPLLLERVFGGDADDRNILLGADWSVRAGRALLIQGQLALDDVGSEGGADDARRPARWGGALSLAGPLGTALSWRGRVTAGSSLLYRTPRPEEYYSDGNIGLGRNHADNVATTMSLGVPVRDAWLFLPEVTWQRQGEGDLRAPFPTGDDLGATPAFFIGTPSDLWRLGAGLAGQEGRLAIHAFGAVQHERNADHVAGRMRTRLEGRIQATVSVSLGGSWR